MGQFGLGLGGLGLTLGQGVGVPAWEVTRRTAPSYATPTGGSLFVSGTSPTALPAGNDSTGDGTAGAPYATITKALSVVGAGGNKLIRCDGTFAENTSSGGRLILINVFTLPVVIDSYSGNVADFILTNASGTSGVINGRSAACANIQFRRCTLRTSTDSCPVFLFNPSSSGFTATNLGFFDCILEGKTQSSNSTAVIDLQTDFALSGLYFVRCSFKKTAGGNTTINPIIIGTHSVTATTSNQPFADVGFWDCSTTDANWYSFTNSNYLVGVAKFTAVRCTFLTATNYGIAIGKDTSGDTAPKCTNIYIWSNTLTCTGSTAHSILVGSNSTASGDPTETDGITVKANTVSSTLQGIVIKGTTNALVRENAVTLTPAASTPSALYAKASSGTKFRNNTVTLDGSSFASNAFREDLDGSNKSSNTELTGNRLNVSGANGTALLWAGSASSTGGGTANDNIITLTSSATLGSVRGTTVTTQADLRAVWAAHGLSGDAVDNDSRSLVA